jgi:hypothetical protein
VTSCFKEGLGAFHLLAAVSDTQDNTNDVVTCWFNDIMLVGMVRGTLSAGGGE